VEAFSDGVFAIAITLLILAVGIDRAPHGDLGTFLVDLWPAYLAYAVSFLTIGIMWANHHLLFDNFASVDRPMLLLNILLLMLIAFVRSRPVSLRSSCVQRSTPEMPRSSTGSR